ncbi:MAG TPA: hypothetical protein VGQ31_02550 [Candidatus Limnocylindrales bacterium]|nr:hypothetical protein [Candidatus Limnocylindrales bacterium]
MTSVPPGAESWRQRWLDPAWQASALGWAERELAALGRSIVGPVEQPHIRPWATAFRLATDDGVAWLKASRSGPGYEGPLLMVFRARNVRRVVLPLAIHPDEPWLLSDDAGPTLRQTRPAGDGDHDLDAWQRILGEYAELQRSLEGDDAVTAMLAAGVPDGRSTALIGELDRLLDDDAVWDLLSPVEAAAGAVARGRLRGALPAIRAAADELTSVGIRPSIQHDDLHGANVMVGPAGDRFFDWGDSVVAQPFATLNVTFNSIAHKTGRRLDDPVFEPLRDTYLEAWSGVAPRSALVRAAALARDLGCIHRSLSWERAVMGLAPGEMDGFDDSIAGWLMELADRLDGPAWAGRSV